MYIGIFYSKELLYSVYNSFESRRGILQYCIPILLIEDYMISKIEEYTTEFTDLTDSTSCLFIYCDDNMPLNVVKLTTEDWCDIDLDEIKREFEMISPSFREGTTTFTEIPSSNKDILSFECHKMWSYFSKGEIINIPWSYPYSIVK
jgi:hypothetical protein